MAEQDNRWRGLQYVPGGDVLKQLKNANKQRQPQFEKKNGKWDLPTYGNALAGETGELCNVLKKIRRGDFTLEAANEKELIADEAADVVIYLDQLCQLAGIDLQTAIVNKFNKKSVEIGSDIGIYYY